MQNVRTTNMQFLAACNWDDELLDGISGYPVYELYGKKRTDIIGGGRCSINRFKDMSDLECARYIRRVRDMGIGFNYLLNSPCHGNKEYEREYQKKIYEFIAWLYDIGVSCVTVATPFLLKFIKNNWPGLRVSVSKFARVNSIQRARYWESLGADSITIDVNINRDFKILSKLPASVNIDLVLLVNDACLYQCPFENYHSVISGHYSMQANETYTRYCSLHCKDMIVRNPAELIRTRFIRPEDLSYYTKIGLKKFKIIDRAKETTWILNAINAYSSETYNGNLADILGRFDTYNKIDGSQSFIASNGLDINIDNISLSGFIGHFINVSCRELICDVDCFYCKRVAEKAVRFRSDDNCKILLNNISNAISSLERIYQN